MTCIEGRLAVLAKEIEALRKDLAHDEAARKQAFNFLRQKVETELETPEEWIWRGQIMAPFAPAALMSLARGGVLHDLVQAGKPKTAAELAASTGMDEMLIVRFMRPLTGQGTFRETGVNTYEATPRSRLLATPEMMGGAWFMFDLSARVCANLPRYFDRAGWKNPDGDPGPFQHVNGSDELFFDYMIRHPDMMSGFSTFMAVSLTNRPDWFHKVDARALVLDGASTAAGDDNVLVVDVGGSKGHDLANFRRAFPEAPGKLVLQDLPPVIDDIKDGELDGSIVRMKHNFLEPQPVRGARLYYMRQIYHDWPSAHCVRIMRNIATAMTRGYSKLLIFEWILPERNVPVYPALLDLNMLALLNSKEKTEREWTALLAEAGLRVVKFYNPDPNEEGIIEAELM